MTRNQDIPPQLEGSEAAPDQTAQYASILGKMALPENRTADFDGANLYGHTVIGFYALLLDDGRLSLGLINATEDNTGANTVQPLDVHDGWKPFSEEVLEELRRWAMFSPQVQDCARKTAEKDGLARPFIVEDAGRPKADIIVVDFTKRTWENIGPVRREEIPNM